MQRLIRHAFLKLEWRNALGVCNSSVERIESYVLFALQDAAGIASCHLLPPKKWKELRGSPVPVSSSRMRSDPSLRRNCTSADTTQ